MDSWNKYTETCLPRREVFTAIFSMEDISKLYYNHLINVWKDFHEESAGKYYAICVQRNIFLLAEVLKNLEINASKHMILILLIDILYQD